MDASGHESAIDREELKIIEISKLDSNAETSSALAKTEIVKGAPIVQRKFATISNLQQWLSPKLKKGKKRKMTVVERLLEQQKLALVNDGRHKTPLATLEMVLTTKAFEKVEHLPKLPTYKNEFVAADQNLEQNSNDSQVSNVAPKAIAVAIPQPSIVAKLSKPLPKCITVKPVTSWKQQVECLRKTVEEELKETKENDIAQIQSDDVINSNLQEHIEISSCLTTRDGASDAVTQTSTRGFQNCGFIQRVNKTETFYLNCFNCGVVYKLSDWQEYVVHYDNIHKRKKAPSLASPDEALQSSKKRILQPTETNNVEVDSYDDIVEKVDDSNPLDEIEVIENVGVIQDCDDLVSVSSLEVDDDNDNYDDDDDDNDQSVPVQNGAVIDFYKTDSERISKFLKTLRSYPILWHPRRCGADTFDKEAEKFLIDFDQAMAAVDLRESLENAHELQRRFTALTLSKQTELEYEPLLRDYLNCIDEIETLSKSFAYYCNKCPFYFLEESELLKHTYEKHKVGDISYVCSCGLHFADAEGKLAHERTHNTEPSYVCEHCGRSFFSQRKVENHILLSHPDAVPNQCFIYRCDICDKSFPHLYMLNYHRLKHDPPRFNCEICGKGYRKAFEFKNHIKGHLNQRDFICEQCGKGFCAKDRLRTHRLRVHKVGEYVCKPCRTYFANNENLHEHMQKFHPNGENLDRKTKQHSKHVKKYHDRLRAERLAAKTAMPVKRKDRKPVNLQCRDCGLKFDRVGALRNHKSEMGHFLGDCRYKCEHCGSILNSGQTFVRHLRKQHQLPTKYADIKNFKPYKDEKERMEDSAENIVIEEVLTAADDDDEYVDDENIVEYVDDDGTYEEVKYAVHNLNYETENAKEIIVADYVSVPVKYATVRNEVVKKSAYVPGDGQNHF